MRHQNSSNIFHQKQVAYIFLSLVSRISRVWYDPSVSQTLSLISLKSVGQVDMQVIKITEIL